MPTTPTEAALTPEESIHATLDLYDSIQGAAHLLSKLEAGEIDGRSFSDLPSYANGRIPCGCLLGNLEFAVGCRDDIAISSVDIVERFGPDRYDWTVPAQDLFTHIRRGHTPANSPHAARAHAAIRQWLAARSVDLASANPLLAPEPTRQAIARLLAPGA